MKKITAETTYRIMDAIAYAITIMCASENPTSSVIDRLSRAITELYCHEEGIEPDYTEICSPADLDLDEDEDEDEEDDEDDWEGYYEEEDEEEEENPIVKAMREILDKYDYFAG